MAWRPYDRRTDRGTAQLMTTLLVLASVALSALVVLALISWLERAS